MRLPCGFGPFELLERVGVGGMAEVFKATAFGASGFEKTIALKLLREEYVGESTWERMFLDEARLQARLVHRGLVQAHDFGAVDGRPWARLDFVAGADLSRLLAGQPAPEPIACFALAEVLTALAFLHEQTDEQGRPLGLVHRDVSATNVLVSLAGEVKLGDFGIAKATLLKDQTRGGVRKGSYAYMSPEQVAGRPLSPASDVFSAGILFVEALTGARPFDGATPVETMERIREAPPSLEAIPAALHDLVAPMLEKDPTRRPRSLVDLTRALRERAADEFSVAEWVRARKAGRNAASMEHAEGP
ncbi:MAG: serine/threonine protein kinase [Myxococcaceae bacterium]|nr:serine/threonine protein kinase [Myxococcaceae bacterium]